METLATGMNKPRVIIGIDPRLFAVSFMIAAGVMWACQLFLGLILSAGITALLVTVFLRLAWKLTNKDARMLKLGRSLLTQKAIYDAGRRDNSRVVIIEER